MPVKYKWLANRLQELIQKNMKNGIDKLPTEVELCKLYKVSRQTVRQALSILEKNAQITKRQGSGSYITGLSVNSSENTIGIILPGSQEYIYPNVIQDIQTTLYQNGYSIRLFETRNRTYKEREILNELIQNPVRGVIVEGCKTALPNPNLDLYQKLRLKGTRIIFLHNYYPALSESLYLKDDNLQGSALLVEHLIAQGHTAIGGIFNADDLQGIERFQGLMETMRDYNLSVPDHRIAWFRTSDIERLLKEHDTSFLKKTVQNSFKSCTSIVCYNDEIAYWLMIVLKSEGYKLPEDMAIVSFDKTYLSNSDMLSITSVSHKRHEMGKKAALLMVEQCKGLAVSSYEIPWELDIRNSTPKRNL